MSPVFSLFATCNESCGWLCALIATLCYGTYGVPIKETKHIPVHPLIFQTYKTGVMFLASWILLLFGVEPKFTPWGLVSGLLWVLGGMGGIVAVRCAGMAIAIGTWASVMICVNFVWGILIFQEPVANYSGTFGAFVFLVLGLAGMSFYSSPSSSSQKNKQPVENLSSDADSISESFEESEEEPDNSVKQDYPSLLEEGTKAIVYDSITKELPSNSNECEEVDSLVQRTGSKINPDAEQATTVRFGCMKMQKRTVGILGAVFNGMMTGSSFIPVHYAKSDGFGGANFLISYATGAVAANALVWLIFLSWRYHQSLSSLDLAYGAYEDITVFTGCPDALTRLRYTYDHLPKSYFKELWLSASAAGLLLTVGMLCGLVSVTILGQGIGNSVIQAKILISGIWGVFYYKEIREPKRIQKWFLSASLSIVGIIWLSQERLAVVNGAAKFGSGDSDTS